MILRRVCPTGESQQGTRKEPLRNEIFTPPEKKERSKSDDPSAERRCCLTPPPPRRAKKAAEWRTRVRFRPSEAPLFAAGEPI